jgi:N-acetylmuramoyl-L-alanine amidase
LAEAVQQSLVEQLGNTDRVALVHRSAYLLKHITAPAIVVEVGFLSNIAEEELLNNEDYQWQLAWAIYGGLLNYLAEKEAEVVPK